MGQEMTERAAAEVFEDHLRLAQGGTVDEDLARNYAADVGFLEWTARAADGSRVEDGADSFVIRDGRIRAQTIHYTVPPAPGTTRTPARDLRGEH